MADEIKTPDLEDIAADPPANDDVALDAAIEPPPTDPRDAQIEALAAEVASLKDRMLRMAAEADNVRKRLEREKAEATLYAATNFAKDLLSVADNLGRALAAVTAEERAAAATVTQNLMAGVEVVERELLNTFQRHGIRKLETVGKKFDPHMEQALFEVPTNEYPPGTVVQEMQSGFAIGDRCLRPAMVGVAKAAD
jgi:molecular chaperone GrpE